MSGSAISLSARALLRLLAGDISVEAFREAHGWHGPAARGDLFSAAMKRGEMITEARLEPGEAGHDDDWITLKLGWDPASGRFRGSGR